MTDEEKGAEVIDLHAWLEEQDRELQQATGADLRSIDAKQIRYLLRCRAMLFALVRREGRVRILMREIEQIPRKSRLEVRHDVPGTLTVSVKE